MKVAEVPPELIREVIAGRCVALPDPGALDREAHASASLILCGYDWNHPVAGPVLEAVRGWADRPPVVVFTGPQSMVEKRRVCMRKGAAAVCSGWDELYDAIERELGVGDDPAMQDSAH